MKENLSVSIIIPTIFRENALKKCLKSINNQQIKPKEVIVVSVKNITEKMLKSLENILGCDIPLIFIYSDSNNAHIDKKIGCEKASGDIVCFLDDDVILYENFIKEILKGFRKNKVDAIQPLIKSPMTDSGLRYVIKKITLLNIDKGKGRIMKSGYPSMPFGSKREEKMEILMGASCFKRTIFENKDYFEPEVAVTVHWADIFFSRNISLDGYEFLYYPEAKMIHFHEPGGRRALNSYVAGHIFNHWLLWYRYIDKNFISFFSYYWSSMWGYILFLFLAIKNGSFKKTLLGLKQGKIWIKRYKKSKVFPSIDEIDFEDCEDKII